MKHIVKITDVIGKVTGPYYFRGLADRNLVFDNFNQDFSFYITIPADDIRAGVALDFFKIGIKKRKWYQFWKPERQRYFMPVIFKLDDILNISSKQSIKVNLPNRQHFFIVKEVTI